LHAWGSEELVKGNAGHHFLLMSSGATCTAEGEKKTNVRSVSVCFSDKYVEAEKQINTLKKLFYLFKKIKMT
jgi:hypothetical protein